MAYFVNAKSSFATFEAANAVAKKIHDATGIFVSIEEIVVTSSDKEDRREDEFWGREFDAIREANRPEPDDYDDDNDNFHDDEEEDCE